MNELMIIKTLIRRPKTIFRRTLLRCVRLMTWAVRLSSVCNVGAPYSQGWTFRKCLHRLTWELGQFVLKFLGRFKGVLDDRLSKMEGWYEKLPFFGQYLALFRKRYKIRPYLLSKTNRNSYAINRMVPFGMILSDP